MYDGASLSVLCYVAVQYGCSSSWRTQYSSVLDAVSDVASIDRFWQDLVMSNRLTPDFQVALARSPLDAGADINAQDGHGRTALHFAIAANPATITDLLLEREVTFCQT